MPLRLLDSPETPQEHIRTALMHLDTLERELRGLGLILSEDQAANLCTPLAAARGRLWTAVAHLEEGP